MPEPESTIRNLRAVWSLAADQCVKLQETNAQLLQALERLQRETCLRCCRELDSSGRDHWAECEQATVAIRAAKEG